MISRVTASDGTTPGAAQSDASPPYLERGSRSDWRTSIALLFAGCATCSLLHCVQPLLLECSCTFGVSLALSA